MHVLEKHSLSSFFFSSLEHRFRKGKSDTFLSLVGVGMGVGICKHDLQPMGRAFGGGSA